MSPRYRWDSVSCRVVEVLLLFICFAVSANYTLAQTTAGTLSGQVVDASGAVVPDATVQVTDLAVGTVRTINTTSDGLYSIPNLTPGHYRVSVTKTGFKTSENPDIELHVYEALTLNLSLEIGAVSQRVTVTAAPPALQTTDASVGQVIEHQSVVQLPLNGRQFTQLILLAPGAAPLGSGQQGAFLVSLGAGGLSPAVGGQTANDNNFTLDGMENNARFDNVYAISPPPDAIAEFNVQNRIDDARFALASGANVNVATRSGTNDFHGDAWEFLRNDKFDARNFFDYPKLLPTGQPFAPTKPAYRQNQFGFTLGGPITIPGVYDGKKGHTYFFGYYEGFRSRRGVTTFAFVPTAAELGGNISGILGAATGQNDLLGRPILKGELYDPLTTRQVTAGQVDPTTGLTATNTGYVRDPLACNGVQNVICSNRLSAAALAYATLYPAANYSSTLGNLIANQNQPTTNNQWGTRIDHTFRNNDTIFGRVSYYHTDKLSAGALPDIPTKQTNLGFSTMLAYNHIFSPTFLLNFHGGYLRTGIPNEPIPAGKALVSKLGWPAALEATLAYQDTEIGPNVGISPRLSGISQYGWGLGNPDYNYQYNFDFTKIHGNHTMMWGLELMHYRHVTQVQPEVGVNFDQFATNDPQSQLGGDGEASYLLGLNPGASQFGFNYTNLSGNIYDIYVQDKWKATSRLTINYGIQWDYLQGPNWDKQGDRISTWDPGLGIFLHATTNPFTGEAANVRPSLFDPVWHDWGPRVGIAYRTIANTVLRASFATFYDHTNGLTQEARDTTTQWPYGPIINYSISALQTFTIGPLSSRSTFNNPLPALPSPSTPIPPNFAVNVRNKNPLANEWNFDVQHAFQGNLVLDVGYVGSADTNLFIQPTANIALTLGPGAQAPKRPWPNFSPVTFDDNVGRSNYHSLQAKLTKTYSNGVTLLGSYTYSRCFNMGDGRGNNQPQSFYNMNASYGPCDFDFPQLFTFSYVYSLPFGKGHSFNPSNKVAREAVSGWQWGGILTLDSGHPFQIGANGDAANTGAGNQRASFLTSSARLVPSGFVQDRLHWFNTDPTQIGSIPYTYGNMSRNLIRGPGQANFDTQVSKSFAFTETKKLEFRAELFNFTNHTQFGQPSTGIGSSSFGQLTSAKAAREIQFALKLFF